MKLLEQAELICRRRGMSGRTAQVYCQWIRRFPSTQEVARVLEAIPQSRIFRLMAELLYGTGLRVSECCTLRVRDIDLGRAQIEGVLTLEARRLNVEKHELHPAQSLVYEDDREDALRLLERRAGEEFTAGGPQSLPHADQSEKEGLLSSGI